MKSSQDLYDSTGKITSKVGLPKEFDVKVDPELIALAIRIHLANRRQATSRVKTRGEVNKTTKKVWKQKGTGRARHGGRGAPIFVGGGVAHGPSGNQSYSLRLPKKMRQKAILGALAHSFNTDKIIIVDGLSAVKPTAKAISTLINKLNLDTSKTLCLLDQPITSFIRGAKNLPHFTVSQAKRTNVYELMNADKIIVHKPALDVLVQTFIHPTSPKISKAK